MSQASDLDRLLKMARIALPGALDSVIQLEFFWVMNKFFQDSNAWRDTATINVDPTLASYDYAIAVDTGSINRLMQTVNSNGTPQSVVMNTPGILTLQVPPAQAETWTATVALTVNDPTTTAGNPDFPAWALNKWGSTILSGILARMMAQPAKPYSNIAMAAYHGKQYNGGISKAKIEANHGNVYAAQNWRFPSGFATSRHR